VIVGPRKAKASPRRLYWMGGQWDQLLLFLGMGGQLWATTDLRLGLDARLMTSKVGTGTHDL
jgi:hypothetical protein